MVQELGETRDAMALDVWNKAQKIANDIRDVKPLYIVFCAKPDPHLRGAVVNGQMANGGIRQSFRVTYRKPQMILGQLVWFVNKSLGIFDFLPELSSPYDIPLDPSMLSDRSEDRSSRVMEKGQQMNVLVS